MYFINYYNIKSDLMRFKLTNLLFSIVACNYVRVLIDREDFFATLINTQAH